jgi:hypothetical protein
MAEGRILSKRISRSDKVAPGLTYGLSKDTWQAFALAVTFYDLQAKFRELNK